MCPVQVSGARDGTIRVWDAEAGTALYRIGGLTAYLDALQFSESLLIATGTNNVVVQHDFGAAPSQDYRSS